LLESHDIAYYETEPSRWMISFGAIWLQDEDREDEALSLLADYQEQRQARERNRYETEGPYPRTPAHTGRSGGYRRGALPGSDTVSLALIRAGRAGRFAATLTFHSLAGMPTDERY